MSKIENETIINWNEEEEMANIYTASRPAWEKCQKLGFTLMLVERLQNGRIVSKEFECSKRCILIRKIPKRKKLTEERKGKLLEGLRKFRSSQ